MVSNNQPHVHGGGLRLRVIPWCGLVRVTALVCIGVLFAGCGNSAERALQTGSGTDSTLKDTPVSARAEFLLSCLEEAGFKSELQWDNGVRSQFPPEQQRAYQDTFTRCNTEAEKKFPLLQFDEAAVRAAYQAELKNRDCLVDAGYSMPAAPSVQEFIDTFDSSRWEAYAALPSSLSETEYRSALTKCWPPSWRE